MTEYVIERDLGAENGRPNVRLRIDKHGWFFNVAWQQGRDQEIMTLSRREMWTLESMISVALRETDPKHNPVTGDPNSNAGSSPSLV